MAYQPRANSLPGKVLDFLSRNPDEELTADDITEKFGGSRNNVHTLMRPALDARLVRREPDVLGELRYRAGPNLDKSGKSGKTPAKVFITQKEVDALQVETGAAIPLVSSNRGQSKWDTLLKKLTANDQSIQIPAEWNTGLSAHVSKLNQQQTGFKYIVRMVSDTHARIWRVAK